MKIVFVFDNWHGVSVHPVTDSVRFEQNVGLATGSNRRGGHVLGDQCGTVLG